MNYAVFKNELRNLYAYERELTVINDRIDEMEYLMAGVKGVNYSKIPGNVNAEANEQKRLDLIEQMDELLTEKKRLMLNISHTYSILSQLEAGDRDAALKIIAKKANAEDVAIKRGYSRSGIWARIRREIEKL